MFKVREKEVSRWPLRQETDAEENKDDMTNGPMPSSHVDEHNDST